MVFCDKLAFVEECHNYSQPTQMYIKLAEYERNEEQQHNTVNAIVEENAALRAELKEAYAMNSRLREALQRQIVDNYEYE